MVSLDSVGANASKPMPLAALGSLCAFGMTNCKGAVLVDEGEKASRPSSRLGTPVTLPNWSSEVSKSAKVPPCERVMKGPVSSGGQQLKGHVWHGTATRFIRPLRSARVEMGRGKGGKRMAAMAHLGGDTLELNAPRRSLDAGRRHALWDGEEALVGV